MALCEKLPIMRLSPEGRNSDSTVPGYSKYCTENFIAVEDMTQVILS